ncbi:class II aldolase/adducin family protein [Amycolatopsis sp. K13G38]|uniref:Class II aldolase/adducin family protein n=1 Tax=Amycolatopsis acididurans TaxID=2724524 RepID=A0ABX1J8L8_9PSEU|nr:class II aldolase/adducin family protein [Amycolatopsis acididurans]NKQ56127.1 class II aldolase/adducin family protein [Amycolatopsis acididurans]
MVNATQVEIAAGRRILFAEGCDSQSAGHVTVRAADIDNAMWTTVFEYFDETLPDGVVKIGYDFTLLEGDLGGRMLAPVLDFHASIYRQRPDVNAIVHHHGHYTAVVASTGGTIGMFNLLSYLFYDDQAVIVEEEASDVTDAERIARTLGRKSVLLMKNHGCIVVGATLGEAIVKSFLLEKAARYHYEAKLIGGTELTDERHLRNYQRDLNRLVVGETWAAQLRRLRLASPEVFAEDAALQPAGAAG